MLYFSDGSLLLLRLQKIADLFQQAIAQAARDAHKRLRQVEFRQQGPDHPILWANDASYYLKFYIFQVVEDR